MTEERPHRLRRVSSWVLVVLACVLAVVSVLVVFVRNEVLDTDTYVATVAPLASDPAIQTAVADTVARQLIAKTDLRHEVASALPSKAGFLAAPITSGVESVIRQVTLQVVQSSQFQTLWRESNRRAHQQIIALLTGSGNGALSANQGKVTLDLGQVTAKVKSALDARGITVLDKVPTTNGPHFVLFESDQITKAQRLVRALDRLALVLPIVTVLCFVGAILLTKNKRRGLVRSATGLAVAMGLLLLLVALARSQYLDSLSSSVPRVAAGNAYDAITAFPLGTTRVILIVAALVALGGVLAGNKRFRRWVADARKPRWFTDSPVHLWTAAHRRVVQLGVLALGLVVLVVWDNPTPLVALVVVVVALVVVAVVGVVGSSSSRPAPTSVGPPSAGPDDDG